MSTFQTVLFWIGALCLAFSAGVWATVLWVRAGEWLAARRDRRHAARFDETFCREHKIDFHRTQATFLGKRS